MDHSVESYLQRQSTETLELLLQQHEGNKSKMDSHIAGLIRKILENREAAAAAVPQ